MPGIFGGAGCPASIYRSLGNYYEKAWSECEYLHSDASVLGGHAFGAKNALYELGNNELVAVDGEPATHRYIYNLSSRGGARELSDDRGLLHLPFQTSGNVVRISADQPILELGADWAGAFPLYYTRWQDGLLFGSLLRPLAKVTEAAEDRLGVLQFLRQGYIYGNRTLFDGIFRLRPGELVRFDRSTANLTRSDRSRLWVGPHVEGDELARICLARLGDALQSSLAAVDSPALMMSGGWDSRTLLAGIFALPSGPTTALNLKGYSHGDTESRELRLAARICQEVGVAHDARAITARDLDPSTVRRNFAMTGTAIFPQWHQSGHALGKAGRDSAIAGIFSGALGGGYVQSTGRGALQQAVGHWKERLKLQPNTEAPPDDQVGAVMAGLRVDKGALDGNWYLTDAFERSIDEKSSRLNAVIRSALERLERRGIVLPDRLIEAFKSEHYACQYIAAQTVNVRTGVDVCVPLANRELMHFASRIPLSCKLNSSLNRKILLAADSSLARYPMASTLVPASAPIPIQEVSRGVRKVWELGRWRAYFATDGHLSPPRLSWVNFEFLRGSDILDQLVDDLRLDIWDREMIRERIKTLASMQRKERMHPYFDQFGKILTVDLLFR